MCESFMFQHLCLFASIFSLMGGAGGSWITWSKTVAGFGSRYKKKYISRQGAGASAGKSSISRSGLGRMWLKRGWGDFAGSQVGLFFCRGDGCLWRRIHGIVQPALKPLSGTYANAKFNGSRDVWVYLRPHRECNLPPRFPQRGP